MALINFSVANICEGAAATATATVETVADGSSMVRTAMAAAGVNAISLSEFLLAVTCTETKSARCKEMATAKPISGGLREGSLRCITVTQLNLSVQLAHLTELGTHLLRNLAPANATAFGRR